MGRPANCARCGLVFEAASRGKLPEYCPPCRYLRQLDASRRWKDRNRDRVKDYRDGYDAEHREEGKERARRWREQNKERIREYRRRLYEERQRADNSAVVRLYRQRNPGKHAEIENRRRARLLACFVEAVDPAVVREFAGGLCGICGEPVLAKEQSLDHITPLALGGTHEYANVQLAHRVCNSRKGARPAAHL